MIPMLPRTDPKVEVQQEDRVRPVHLQRRLLFLYHPLLHQIFAKITNMKILKNHEKTKLVKLHPNSNNQPAKKLVKVKNEVQVRKNKRILRFLRSKKLLPIPNMNKKGHRHSRNQTGHKIVEDLKNQMVDVLEDLLKGHSTRLIILMKLFVMKIWIWIKILDPGIFVETINAAGVLAIWTHGIKGRLVHGKAVDPLWTLEVLEALPTSSLLDPTDLGPETSTAQDSVNSIPFVQVRG